MATRLGLGLGGLALALTVTEGFFRLQFRYSNARVYRGQPDPVLHHALPPSATGRYDTDEWTVVMHTNSLGLRDRELAVPKPAGVFRIVMLGDSFTQGWGVTVEESAAKQLEARLNADPALAGCRRFEVVNAGVASYSPLLEYLQLETKDLALEPDLAILNFDMTDPSDDVLYTSMARFAPDGRPLAVPPEKARSDLWSVLPKPGWLRPLRNLYSYRELDRWLSNHYWKGRTSAHEGDLAYDTIAAAREGGERRRDGWELSLRYIGLIADLLREHRIGFVLTLYPWPHQASARESIVWRQKANLATRVYDGQFEPIRRFAAERHIVTADLVDLFRKNAIEHTGEPLYFTGDPHMNAAGERLLASGVLAELERYGLLPACAGRGKGLEIGPSPTAARARLD